LSIEEGYSSYYANYGMGGGESLGLKAAAVSASPTIEPGSEEIKVTVTLRYEIK